MPRIALNTAARWPLVSLFVLALAGACSDDPPEPLPSAKAGTSGKGGRGGSGQTAAGNGTDAGGEPSNVGGTGEGEAGAPVAPIAGTSGSGGSSSGGSAGTGGSGGSTPAPRCGDGNVAPGEECDNGANAEGNPVGGDGCSSTCKSACEECLKAEPCIDTVDLGEEYYKQAFVTQNEGEAQGGPAAGVSKRELTANLFECYLENAAQCATPFSPPLVSVQKCWCANEITAECTSEATMLDGPCIEEAEEATETTNPAIIEQQLNGPGYASGRAWWLLNCAWAECAAECLPHLVTGGGGTGGTSG
jgi:cysteine-rich repeat protein